MQCHKIMSNQGNMTPPEETTKSPMTDPKEMVIYELSDKEFRIILSKNFSELEENTGGQLNNIGKTIHEQD